MASADFCLNITAPLEAISFHWNFVSGSILDQAFKQISQGKTRDFPPTYPPHIHHHDPNVIGLRVYWSSRPRDNASCDSCSSGREFACRFLQIRSRPRHPCGSTRLEVPDIKASIGTFTQQVNSWIAFAHQLSSVNQDASRHA